MPTSFSHIVDLCLVTFPLPLLQSLQYCYCYLCHCYRYYHTTLLLNTLLHHPFLFKGKQTQCSRGNKKDLWRHCRGVYAQVKTYQVPITNSYPSHYIICHLPLVFLAPSSPMPFYSPFFCSSFRLL